MATKIENALLIYLNPLEYSTAAHTRTHTHTHTHTRTHAHTHTHAHTNIDTQIHTENGMGLVVSININRQL
jgi:ABC-type Zn2+ transport system substrate-binding protein/surface adhesin